MSDFSGHTVSANQARALRALVNGATQQEAAAAAGVTPRTVTRWLGDPEFQGAYRASTSRVVQQAARTAETNTERVLERVLELVDHDDPAVALRACRYFADWQQRLTDVDNVFQRLDRLEGILKHAKDGDVALADY